MAAIGFLSHDQRPLAAELVADLAAWLIDRGHEVRLTEADASRLGRHECATPDEELAIGLDLLVGVGGDGTILRAVDLATADDVPVLGVNAGQLGYLTTVEPTGARAAVKRFLAGAYIVEERMRLAGRIVRSDGSVQPIRPALNEVLVERAELGHTVRIEVTLDAAPFTSYVADGLILATPTGSTAYALSARGPIVDPRHRAQLLVPVAPHMLFDRSLVLAPDTVVSLRVVGPRAGHLSVDGRSDGRIEVGDVVTCDGSGPSARLVQVGAPAFHRVLVSKFGLQPR